MQSSFGLTHSSCCIFPVKITMISNGETTTAPFAVGASYVLKIGHMVSPGLIIDRKTWIASSSKSCDQQHCADPPLSQ